MSYLVLSRKYRPQTFASVVGQEHITKALANSLVRGRVPHALVLTGPRGVGKTTSARVLAKALNCTGRSLPDSATVTDEAAARKLVEPCGQCTNCQEIARSASMAVWEIDGASNNSVENVRDLIDSLRALPPPGSHYKIYIIDEVHMLSTSAFNALLKSLEEPPPNTVFIFATTEPHKIPETVLSRCQRFDCYRLPSTVIVGALEQVAKDEGVAVEPGVFEFIARKAQGGMRDAQSMFDRLLGYSFERIELQSALRVFGSVDNKFFSTLAEAIFAHEPSRCFSLLDEVFRQSLDIRAFAADFITFWRNLLIVSLSSEGSRPAADTELSSMLELSSDDIAGLRALAAKTSAFDIQRQFRVVEKVVASALSSNFPRYLIEAGIAQMVTLSDLRPLAEIVATLEGKSPSAPLRNAPINDDSAIKKKPSIVTTETTFNPSWEEFLAHVKNRSEPVLGAYLRRITPKVFGENVLELQASAFDIQSLKDADMLATLRRCLHSYSGIEAWEVRFSLYGAEVNVIPVKRSSRYGVDAPQSTQPIPGSVQAVEEERERELKKKVESEAYSHPLVQEALKTFAGSRIEKVTVLKRAT